MDPKLAKFVDLAMSLSASGRVDALHTHLVDLTVALNDVSENWVMQVFNSLTKSLLSEFFLLRTAFDDTRADGSLVAWRARNLLEISVWCIYCSQDRENARRLFEDAGRDAREIIGGFKQWGVIHNMPTDWMDYLKAADENLTRQAAAVGISSLDGSYKRVSAAAKHCGLENQFRTLYGYLSKFVHPTAMQILGQSDAATVTTQKDLFFSQGCMFFAGGFSAIEDRVGKGWASVASVLAKSAGSVRT
jgi:hypothetical protein